MAEGKYKVELVEATSDTEAQPAPAQDHAEVLSHLMRSMAQYLGPHPSSCDICREIATTRHVHQQKLVCNSCYYSGGVGQVDVTMKGRVVPVVSEVGPAAKDGANASNSLPLVKKE